MRKYDFICFVQLKEFELYSRQCYKSNTCIQVYHWATDNNKNNDDHNDDEIQTKHRADNGFKVLSINVLGKSSGPGK